MSCLGKKKEKKKNAFSPVINLDSPQLIITY